MLFANLTLIGILLSRALPEWTDGWFFFWQGLYYVPLAALWFSRSKRVDLILLTFLVIQYQLPYTGIFPGSQWGNAAGVNGEAAKAATIANVTSK